MAQNIYTHDTIYIPPREEDSAPLEVALGCSWSRCTFCDFARDAFRILPREKIQENIGGLALLFPKRKGFSSWVKMPSCSRPLRYWISLP